jgi:hypothetical protein
VSLEDIPEPYRAWCHLCAKGFMTIDEIQQHNRDSVVQHQKANAEQTKGKK